MMKKKVITIVLSFSLFVPICVSADSTSDLLDDRDYKNNELIVIFNDDLSNNAIKKVVENEDATVKNIKQLDDDSKSVRVKVSDDLETAIDNFSDNPRVSYVQPNYKYKINNSSVYSNSNYQYYFDLIGVKDAWSLVESKGINSTLVSVIDTGTDVKHEDLQKNLVSNKDYVQTVGGTNTRTIYDSDYHGTHVSGIIGATNGNNSVTGVASGNNNNLVKIMPVGASFDGNSLYTSDIIDAIKYSKNNGAKVINMSFGGEGRDRAMEAAIRDAYDSGIVLVAASGNDGIDTFSSPSDFKEVISVNASNQYNKPMYWSDYGINKDITAPGYNILSTTPGNTYNLLSGTSMASPVVAGVVALMLDANPNLTPAEVYNILCASTSEDSFSELIGYGIVNAKEAVSNAINASDSVAVSNVSIKNYDATVYVDDDIYLESLVRPANSLKKVTWSSSDESVAKVDSVTGRVTGVKAGYVTITASVSGKSDSILVRVKESLSQSGISIENKSDYSNIVKGASYELNAKILPLNATNQEVYWTSSDRKIADVDELGVLTGKSAGTCTITVKTYDGKYSDSFDVVVTNPTSIKLTKYTYKLLVGNKYTFSGYVLDSDSKKTIDKIVWSSTNPSVAKINSSTGEVTALKAGTTYIVGTVKGTEDAGLPVKYAYRLYVGKSNYSLGDYNLKISNKTYNSVTLSWNKINVASKYVVERATSSGAYVKLGEFTGTSYKDSKVVLGKKYSYRIKAIYNSSKSFGYSYSVNALISLNKPVISVNNYKSRYLKISWNKVSGASGYTIYRSTLPNSGYKAIVSTSKNSYINGKLVKNKKYYYKIRAYKVVNGTKVYSAYSDIKSRVVK